MATQKGVPIFGKRVKQQREKLGWSIQELATKADMWYQTIWRIERGTLADPGISLARRLARTLGVSTDHLMGTFEENEYQPATPALVGA